MDGHVRNRFVYAFAKSGEHFPGAGFNQACHTLCLHGLYGSDPLHWPVKLPRQVFSDHVRLILRHGVDVLDDRDGR